MTQAHVIPGLFVAALLVFSSCAGDQRSRHDAVTLGVVNFSTSCRAEVTETFNRGIAFLHSFEYPKARAEFQAAADEDEACGMAYWGEAMSNLYPVWSTPMTPQRFIAGNIAAEKAEAVGAATERELAYIAAINAYLRPRSGSVT